MSPRSSRRMLLFPKAVFSGAEEGLLLWFQIIFPTLFPYLVATSLLLSSGGLSLIAGIFGGVFRRIFRVSKNGTFAVLSGFLCGYPMGAKVTADLLRAGRISQDEARYLLSFCNNTSPVFIINFIVWKTFGNESLMLPGLSILIGTPVLLSFAFRKYYLKGRRAFPDPSPALKEKKTCFNFSVLDSCMMNSFESIVKVGGYIILFSVLLSLLKELAGQNPAVMAAAPVLEVTNGIPPDPQHGQRSGDLLCRSPRPYILRRALLDCPDSVHAGGHRTVRDSLYHTKTDCRSDSHVF